MRKKVALVGCGNLGGLIAKGITNELGRYYDLTAVLDSREEAAQALAQRCGCIACGDVEGLLAERPDYVVEAANPAVLRDIALPAVRAGADLLPLSAGAFADDAFYRELRREAEARGRRVYVSSGAIGGFDLMQAAVLAGPLAASIVTRKAPGSLRGAPGLQGRDLPEGRETVVFSGSAREAIERFPQNVNVAVSLAAATVGTDDTRVEVRSVPGLEHNTHSIRLQGAFGEATLTIASRPSPDNPKSSVTAAFSVLAKLKNLAEPIAFC